MRRSKNVRCSQSEKALLFKKLGVYLSAGLPLLRSLSYAQEQLSSASGRRLLLSLEDSIRNGESFSHALKKFPSIFSPFICGFVQAGESSGSLAQTCEYISISLEKNLAVRRKVLGACLYPCIVLLATAGIALFLILYVFPRILPVLDGFHQALPLPTRILLLLQHVLVAGWPFFLIGISSVIIGLSYMFRQRSVRIRAQNAFLGIPGLGKIYCCYQLAILARTLAFLSDGGIQIISALELAKQVHAHNAYGDALEIVGSRIMEGKKFSECLRGFPLLFPSLTIQLVELGEETGTLRKSLHTLADIYSAELDASLQLLSTLIEPALILVLGLCVGFIALAIVTPMYQMASSLSTQ